MKILSGRGGNGGSGGSGGDGQPNEKGSNGGHGGNGIIILNPFVLNINLTGGRGKFAGNGGHGGIGGKFSKDLRFIPSLFDIKYIYVACA